MGANRRLPGRIFINYRRDDSGGTAGRLADSLTRYFGPGRVFRDIDGIDAGANFEDVLQRTAQDADAMIVLIGRQWARLTNDAGKLRLHDANDWVAREIAAALERKIPIYPVLVESAVMPRTEELPPPLQPLVRYNAISLSDQRWTSDVQRLARIVAIDIPGSLAERTLGMVQAAVSLALWVALALPTVLLTVNHFNGTSPVLSRAESAVAFILISAAVVVLLFWTRLVDTSARWWIHAAVAVGLLGTLGSFLWFYALGVNAPTLPIAMFCGSTLTAAAVLALMNLSRFKPR